MCSNQISRDPQPLTFTGASDMSEAMVSQWFRTPYGRRSFQVWWPATGAPAGVFSPQVSSDGGTHASTKDPTTCAVSGAQPAGTAGTLTLDFESGAPYTRLIWTPSSGGAGAAPGGTITNSP